MSNFLNMEFVQALNPLYAFPIVTVILCVFVVYAFGFKSPVQPPSFEGIEEEKKVSKKRKPKETNKQGKVIQNGKLNGSTGNKPQVSSPGKKKDVEKSNLAEKPSTEKSSASEKKAAKKAKSLNEKKSILAKKKETVINEDTTEDGWVQLLSKKGRKSRKKDEASLTEITPVIAKPAKVLEVGKSDDSSPSEESLEKTEISVQSSVPENLQPLLNEEKSRKKEALNDEKSKKKEALNDEKSKKKEALNEEKSKKKDALNEEKSKKKDALNELSKPTLKEEKSKKKDIKEERNVVDVASNIENKKIEVDVKQDSVSLDKVLSKENVKTEKPIEESSNKSKKKKKKNAVVVNTDNESLISLVEPPPIKVMSEPSVDKCAAINSVVTVEASQVVSDKIEGNQSKESKSSNVVFDELAGLYPEPKEQRKKKKVRRDH